MAGSATLNVAVLVNAAQAAAGFNQVSDKAESTGSKMTKAFAGLVAGAGLVSFAKDAVASLSRIETINAQSAQTIKSTGGAANVSAGHVEELALLDRSHSRRPKRRACRRARTCCSPSRTFRTGPAKVTTSSIRRRRRSST